MAAIRKVLKHGRTRWRLSWYDAVGQRRQKFYRRRDDAVAQQAKSIEESRQRRTPTVDPSCTVEAYAADFFPRHVALCGLKRATLESYLDTVRLHIAPTIGQVRMRAVGRSHVQRVLAQHRAAGYARDSTRIVQATLSVLCVGAVEDGLLGYNPTAGFRRQLRLGGTADQRAQEVLAFTEDELRGFLQTARQHSRLWDLYTVMGRTGMRHGEAIALQTADLDAEKRILRVQREIDGKARVGTPKGNRARDVDASLEAVALLQGRARAVKEAKLARRWSELPPWYFVTRNGTPYGQRNVLDDFKRVLERAKLPRHFSPKSLRHTYATLHINRGATPAWLQAQLGHESLTTTLDVYGRWFRQRDLAAADRLDAPEPLVVTKTPILVTGEA